MILGYSTIQDKDIKYIELVTWIESWIESQFMTGNWANIRNQHTKEKPSATSWIYSLTNFKRQRKNKQQ